VLRTDQPGFCCFVLLGYTKGSELALWFEDINLDSFGMTV